MAELSFGSCESANLAPAGCSACTAGRANPAPRPDGVRVVLEVRPGPQPGGVPVALEMAVWARCTRTSPTWTTLVAVVVPLLVRIDKPNRALLRGADCLGMILMALCLGCLEYSLEEDERWDWSVTT